MSRLLTTPRGQLLRTLAAEAAAAQKQRSLRATHQTGPSIDEVLAVVDGALSARGAAPTAGGAPAPSPSRIPKPGYAVPVGSSQPVPAAGASLYGRSPSKIPRLASSRLSMGRQDENSGGISGAGPPSPGKGKLGAGGQANPLRSSVENLRV